MTGRDIETTSPVIVITLADAVYLGLRNNRVIRSAYLQRIAQKFDLRVAESKFSPKLEISSGYLAHKTDAGSYQSSTLDPVVSLAVPTGARFGVSWLSQTKGISDSGKLNSTGLSLSIIQPLLRGAGIDANTASVRTAQLSERMYFLLLKSTVSRTVTDIVLAYRALLQTQAQLVIAQDSLSRSKQLLAVNRDLIAAGRMAAVDIVQAEADEASQELAIEDASNQVHTSRLALLTLLSLDLTTQVQASDEPAANEVTTNLADSLKVALDNQPDYVMQVLTKESADLNLMVAQNQRWWDVSLVAGTNQLRTSVIDAATDTTKTWDKYAGVQVSIPIGDLTRKQNEVQASVDSKTQALQLEELKQQLEQQVSGSVRSIGTYWRQYQIASKVRALSEQKLAIEREKLQSGRSSNFQVLSFENDLRTAESSQLTAMFNYLNGLTLLDLQLGVTLDNWGINLND